MGHPESLPVEVRCHLALNVTTQFHKLHIIRNSKTPVEQLPSLGGTNPPHEDQAYKISSPFSCWFDTSVGVPQGLILGPLLFNVFINDLFFMIIRSDVCNFADDNTSYSCDKKLENICVNQKIDLKNVLYWF